MDWRRKPHGQMALSNAGFTGTLAMAAWAILGAPPHAEVIGKMFVVLSAMGVVLTLGRLFLWWAAHRSSASGEVE